VSEVAHVVAPQIVPDELFIGRLAGDQVVIGGHQLGVLDLFINMHGHRGVSSDIGVGNCDEGILAFRKHETLGGDCTTRAERN
jgi:hypothetical protein